MGNDNVADTSEQGRRRRAHDAGVGHVRDALNNTEHRDALDELVATAALLQQLADAEQQMQAGEPSVDAPTVHDDGTPMPKFRLAITLLVDSHGVDASDATHRALSALRVPSGPFNHSVDTVRGPANRWMCKADVVHANRLMWRELEPANID